MTPDISERTFEEAIECALLRGGPDACAGTATSGAASPFGDTPPGGYRRRRPEDYDRSLCLLPRDVLDFVLATQPKAWLRLSQHHGADVEQRFLKRVSGEIESYIEAELERRARKFDALFTRGPTYASDNYGRLEFLEGDRFTWTGYFRLVPAVVPQGVGTTGRVDYGYYLASALRGTYDGALSFVFDGATTPATFAYAFRDGGVRLVYVPTADTRDRIVLREGVSPLTIFMSSIGG